MPPQETNIVVQITSDYQDIELDLDKLKSLTHHICRQFDVTDATVSIAIVDDDTIEKVNARFLNKSNPTDVISFDLSDDTDPAKTFELLINADEAKRQSQKRKHPTEAELALYITHGLLHNLGFDDNKPENAEKMHQTEDEILQQTGFGVIYNRIKKG